MNRPTVVYWNNQPTPYVVARLNAVARRGTIDIEAWFDGLREQDRSWDVDTAEWEFPARFIPECRIASRLMTLPLAELRAVRPNLLITNYDRLNHLLGAIAARHLAQRVAVRCLPSFDAWTPPNRAHDFAKHLLFRSIDSAKVPGPDGRAYADRYGLPSHRTWPVTQSIDVAHYARARSIDPQLREHRRQELGLHGCVFLYAGRLWSGKGVATLLAAYQQVRDRCPDVSLIIAGDGPDEDRLRAASSTTPGVAWLGFVQPTELPKIYALADVMVFPTLGDPNGLVVEEAMAAGLPVISTSAAGDIRRRLPEGIAGHIVPPANADAFADRMLDLARAPRRRAAMAQAGAHIADQYVTEAYAEDFERFVQGTLALPRRQGPVARSVEALSRLLPVVVGRDRQSAVTPLIAPRTKTG
jgi:glycosyltransferase involved in cell wall biosynthesis